MASVSTRDPRDVPARPDRFVVTTPSGKDVKLFEWKGQIFVCFDGCCCGDTSQGKPAVPKDVYETEWLRRKLGFHVQLTIGGCLGPCALANVVMLLFDGRSVWFQAFNEEAQVVALFDYVEAMVRTGAYAPPPPELAPFQFTVYDWSRAEEQTTEHGTKAMSG